MTEDRAMEIYRELPRPLPVHGDGVSDFVVRCIMAACAEEREQCAKVADYFAQHSATARSIAKAIREGK